MTADAFDSLLAHGRAAVMKALDANNDGLGDKRSNSDFALLVDDMFLMTCFDLMMTSAQQIIKASSRYGNLN